MHRATVPLRSCLLLLLLSVTSFLRALQLAPSHAYAHTLLGIEYSVADEQERALASLKTAVACNPRMFQAW